MRNFPKILLSIFIFAHLDLSNSFIAPSTSASDSKTNLEKLPWQPNGYENWSYTCNNGLKHNINFTSLGSEEKPALLLCHGFGASLFHWRYNLPELSKHYRVYAIDLLGFGFSDKPLIDYGSELWSHQISSFINEIVGKKTVVLGNSLGGFAVLHAAANYPELIEACVLINSAGKFESLQDAESNRSDDERPNTIVEKFKQKLKEYVQRAVIAASFYYTKQPTRIRQVLKQVYSVDPSNVDDELVESIQLPSFHSNAGEVFFRIIAGSGNESRVTMNQLLSKLERPLLILWGENDPWIRSSAADTIKLLYPEADRVSINAGHCPHDEVPEIVNNEIVSWLRKIGHV